MHIGWAAREGRELALSTEFRVCCCRRDSSLRKVQEICTLMTFPHSMTADTVIFQGHYNRKKKTLNLPSPASHVLDITDAF